MTSSGENNTCVYIEFAGDLSVKLSTVKKKMKRQLFFYLKLFLCTCLMQESNAQSLNTQSMRNATIAESPVVTSTNLTTGVMETTTPKKGDVKPQLTQDVYSTGVCQNCTCNDDSLSPLTINCSHRHIADAFKATDWPHDVLVSSIAISFASNKLFEIRQYPELPIIKLNLRDNNIQFIEKAAFKYLKQLSYLDLSKNSLTHESLTSDTFEGVFNESDYEPLPLKTLRLGYNEIHSIDKDVFDHLATHLEVLELNNNPIKVIDHQTAIAITSLRKLKTLNMAETEISSLPDGFLHALPNLKTLILSGNGFSVVPTEMKRATVLEQLNLNNNPITTFDITSFEGLSRLRKLNVSSMPALKKIGPNAFTPLQSMTHLWCSYNPALKSISPSAFANMGHSDSTLSLSEFHFRENKIQYLPHNLLPWDEMDVIDIQGNPFVCDCHVTWIAKNVVPLIAEKTPELTSSLKCAGPAEYKGQSLDQLPSDKASCSNLAETDDEKDNAVQPPTLHKSNNGVIMLSILAIAAVIGCIVFLFFFLTLKKANLRRLYDTGTGQIVHYVRTASGSGKQDDEHAIVEREFTQYQTEH